MLPRLEDEEGYTIFHGFPEHVQPKRRAMPRTHHAFVLYGRTAILQGIQKAPVTRPEVPGGLDPFPWHDLAAWIVIR